MSISNLYTTGFQQRNRDHFAALVSVAMADNKMSQEEKDFLKRTALNLQIDENVFESILENTKTFNINPSFIETERYERLFDLIRMVIADHISKNSEKSMVIKLAIGLGFPVNDVEKIVTKSLQIVGTCDNATDFTTKLKA